MPKAVKTRLRIEIKHAKGSTEYITDTCPTKSYAVAVLRWYADMLEGNSGIQDEPYAEDFTDGEHVE